MKIPGRHSISARIATSLTLLISICIVCFSAIIILLTRQSVFHQRDSDLLHTLQMIENGVRSMKADQLTPSIDGIPYYMLYRISAPDGRLLKTNDPMIPQLPVTPPGRAQRYYRENFFSDGNLNLRYAAKEITSTQDSRSAQSYHIQVALDIDTDVTDNLLQFMPAVFAVCCIPVLLLSWITAYRTAHKMLLPVQRITKQAQEIGSEHLDRRLDESGADDELRQLAHTFNELFARLQKDFDRQKRFASDVSHELKTPLAVVSGYVDMLLRWGRTDEAILDESLGILKRETQSMTHLIEALLKLNRSQNEALSTYKKEPIELYPFLNSVQQDFMLISPQSQITIDCSQDAVVLSDAEGLREILRILIQNSIQYSASPARITIAYHENVLTVADRGCGISPEDLPHIFDSFYRADKARSRSSGNNGLGLAIAKAVAERMNIVLTAESKVDEGTVMRLCFAAP